VNRIWLLGIALALAGMLNGCSTYEKDVSSNSFFSGLDGAEGPSVDRKGLGRNHDPRFLTQEAQRTEDHDGNVTLQARSPRHLMRHIFETVRDEDIELFLDQVLSEATKREFQSHGRTPEDAFWMLHDELDSIDKLFARMPMAEHSPNATFTRLGDGVHRLRLVRGTGRDLRWQGFDMISEDGNERLLWFYEQR
jgi:hypothetical protein